jgi:hypothetical protein
MGVGKYSPTVSAAYARDQEWHRKLQTAEDWHDDEGYDSYGYHRDTELDRAGFSEWDYMSTFETDGNEFYHSLYDHIINEWTFDGVRPIKRADLRS